MNLDQAMLALLRQEPILFVTPGGVESTVVAIVEVPCPRQDDKAPILLCDAILTERNGQYLDYLIRDWPAAEVAGYHFKRKETP